jgi:pimeloyl-ACP methyl ester carboxylesterase
MLSPIFPKLTRNIAFELLCRVEKIPVREEGQVFFDSGETHWLQIAGYRTALYKWGNGPKKVLFLHGWTSNSQRWKDYVESMDPNEFSCYALDAPGHGTSEGNYLNLEIFREAYEKSLEITGPLDVLIGHSLGNLVAGYQFLHKANTVVKSYVIMGSPSGMEALFDYFEDILGLSPRMLRNLGIKINEVLKIPYESASMEQFFRRLDKPLLLIHEESDAITPIGPIREAAKHALQIETFYTNGLDHTLKSSDVLRKVISFIDKQTKKEEYVLERI